MPRSPDLNALSLATDDFIRHLRVFVKSGHGTLGARNQEFRVKLEPFREFEVNVLGLKGLLDALEAAPSAAVPDATPEAKVKFILALQNADREAVEANKQFLILLHWLFEHNCESWFLEAYAQDLPIVPDDEAYGGRENIVTVSL